MKKSQFPSFFYDDSESDKVEEVMDYFISWTLRCAKSQYKEINPLVNKYAKRILSRCLYDDANKLDDKTIREVLVCKQWKHIDLWVEIDIEGEQYALIIESKMHAAIRKDQLPKYKEIVQTHFESDSNYKLEFVLLRGNDFKEMDKEQCDEFGYKLLNLQELHDAMQATEVSGHDLFDEFWFYWWSPSED